MGRCCSISRAAAATAARPCVSLEAEFRTGPSDVFLGEIAGCPFYIGAAQFEYWAHTQLIIDVVAGRGGGFSVEAPEGLRFLTRGRVFSDAELLSLGAPPNLNLS